MKHGTKISISIISLICVIALMVTGVHAATSAGFSVINSVAYTFDGTAVTITCYAGNPFGVPSTSTSLGTIVRADGSVIGDELSTDGSNADYHFEGWYAYDFTTHKYSADPYDFGTVLDSAAIGGTELALFERYTGPNVVGDVMPTVDVPVDYPDLGITVTMGSDGNASVKPIKGETNVTIPAALVGPNGEKIPITTIEKGQDWSEVTSLNMKDSNITKLTVGSIGADEGDAEGPVNVTTLILPSGLTEIEGSWFSSWGDGSINNLKVLEKLVIPSTVTTIEGGGIRFPSGSKCIVFCERETKPGGWNVDAIKNEAGYRWGLDKTWYYGDDGLPYEKTA